jgi:hypothetical protein
LFWNSGFKLFATFDMLFIFSSLQSVHICSFRLQDESTVAFGQANTKDEKKSNPVEKNDLAHLIGLLSSFSIEIYCRRLSVAAKSGKERGYD